MFCNACGDLNPEGSLFCSRCGAAMSVSAATAAPGTTPAPGASSIAYGTKPTVRTDERRMRSFDEEAWKAVIGPKNQAYYVERFAKMHAAGGGLQATWHWPAFFVTWYWVLYRKMWGWCVFYFFFPTVVAIVAGLLVGHVGGSTSMLMWGLVFLLLWVAPAVLANTLYYRHCTKLMRAERSRASREKYLARLEAKGGASNFVVAFIAFSGLVSIVGIAAAIAIPAYQDYTIRAKVAAAITSGMAVARVVGDQYERTGNLPENLESLPNKPAISKYVASMEINPQNGFIQIQTSVAVTGAAGSIYLVPSADADRHVSWTCKSAPEMVRFVPHSCRVGG